MIRLTPFGRLGVVLLLFPAILIYIWWHDALLRTKVNQLGIEVERRILWWNWQDTHDEIFCRSAHELVASQSPIPNVAHFIMLSDEGTDVELNFARFLAIKAAILRMSATEIKIHTTGINRQNRFWKDLDRHVTIVHLDRETLYADHPLPHNDMLLPHLADFLRIEIILREGGIYLDTDMFVLKPFTNLLSNPRDIVMGHEGGNRYGLCNAVIVARAGSGFLARWYHAYETTFNPKGWNQHSVLLPKQLQVQHPELICALSPTVFFWPTWAKTHVSYMHEEILSTSQAKEFVATLSKNAGAMYENQLAFHAWAAQDYMKALTPERVRTVDTRFNLLVRGIVDKSI